MMTQIWDKLLVTYGRNFFQEGICNTIQNRVNEYAIGLYSDYTQQGYHVLTGVEVSELNNSNLESE